jgi:diacylglycerol kinase (ATP)
MRQILIREWQCFRGQCISFRTGLVLEWREEHPFRFWLLAFGMPIALSFWVLIVYLEVLVLATECSNTAIGRVVDHLSLGQHPLAKAVKDAGSARGLALTAVVAGVAWALALWGLL